MYYKSVFLFLQIFISFSYSELSLEKKDKLLNGFIDFYNNLPNQIYTCEEGTLQNADHLTDNYYTIEVSLQVADIHNLDSVKSIKCTARIQDIEGARVIIINNEHHCEDIEQRPVVEEVLVTESAFVRKPVQLDNEVESNTAVTSGEQFIAVPREEPGAPCIGCATHINPQAAGVTELATLGVRHLDRHEPNVRHTLNTVLDVERQVQVVNGVRYILTLLIDYDNCSETQTDSCQSSNTCRISILEKPWVRLPRGGKYRAIIGNNCTEEWQFGDNGEVIGEEDSNNRENNEIAIHPKKENAADDVITAVHADDVQAQQNQDKTLTDEQVKTIEQQIIPHSEFSQLGTTEMFEQTTLYPNQQSPSKEHAVKQLKTSRYNENTINQPDKKQQSSLTDDKKKTIEELMNFFEFSSFISERDNEKNTRTKRSYDHDLEAMLLVDNFQTLHKSLKNGKYLYSLAQIMVDYLNEMDLAVKTRTLKDVLKAEHEIVNYQNFYYIQARVLIPCDKAVCESKDTIKKICNGIIEGTDKKHPHVLTAFCYNEGEDTELNKVNSIPFDDPLLHKMLKDSVKKIEKESLKPNAVNVSEIISASTQRVSGTLTKIAIILEYLNCTKDTPIGLRKNCSILHELGSDVCELVIHEKHELKERQITYNCIDRPLDTMYAGQNKLKNIDVDDAKVKEMVQEALQYLELQSNRNNKQKVVAINSVQTELNAGLVTKIEFIVGYTSCSSNTEVDLSNCPLLAAETLRKCNTQIWDRTWIEDGRQVEVICDDMSDSSKNDSAKLRKKRSLYGGKESKDINDPHYKTLAQESLSNYLKSSGGQQHFGLIRLDHVDVQLVAGKLTRIDFTISPTDCQIDSDGQPTSPNCSVKDPSDIATCHSEIWERPWLQSEEKQMTVDCFFSEYNKREKRSLVGGKTDQNPNNPLYNELAMKSLNKYLQNIDSTTPHKVVRVEKVTTQVVSGMLTIIHFSALPTDQNSGDVIRCVSEVWEQPWRGTEEIDVNCNLNNKVYRPKREISCGGPVEHDPSDPEYIQLAVESMQKYLESVSSTKPHKLVSVQKVTTQVVSGISYEIDFMISPIGGNSGDVITCHSNIWDQSWLKKKEFKVDCKLNNQKYRAKRATLTGGETEQDPSDPTYTQLAEESMQKYLESVDITEPHRLVSVEKVTTQVVSGIKTRIEFIVAPVDGNSSDVLTCNSEIWEQAWNDIKEITVDCLVNEQNYRDKREAVPGGETEQDPSKPEYIQLAKESMQKYLESVGSTKSHKLVSVQKVTTQVVSGILYKMDFIISPVDVNSGDVITCHSKIWAQPWLKKKEFTVDCKLNNIKYRTKRGAVPGGKTEQDPSKPEYTQLAVESMQKYLESVSSTKPHKLVSVQKVTTQVVSGISYEIDFVISPIGGNSGDVITCHSKIWDQPWLKKKEFTVDCKLNNQKYRAKRQTFVGGKTEQDPSKPEYAQLAVESMQKYLESVSSTKPHKLISVQKVTTQVVSGISYEIDFVISPIGGNSGDVITCHSKIWDRPWLKNKEFTVDCKLNNKKYRAKRGAVPGGETEQDPSKPEYLQLAKESMQKYLESVGSTKSHKLVSVQKVTTQVVSGILYNMDFIISPVDVNSGDVITCHSKIWAQPWLKKKEFTVDCKLNNIKYRAKRGAVPGGKTEQDPSKPEYTQLAVESMQKYLESVGNTKPHKLVSVQKVTTQVVSGISYEIDFKISPIGGNSGDVITCHSNIWDQPWLKKKEFKVDCKLNNQKHRAKRATVPGGETEQDPSDPTYTQLAEESMQKYLESVDITEPHRLVSVEKVTTQVVSGIKTRIEFIVAPVDGNSSDVLTCNSEIWEQAWNDIKEITVDCLVKEQNYRDKREAVPGGETEQDPSKPEYIQLAKESMQKYLESVGSTKSHKLVRVQKVTTQVVSGILYKMDFIISPVDVNSGDVITCHSKVWDRSWLKKKEFTVDCKLNNQKYRAKRATFTNTNNVDIPKREKRNLKDLDVENEILENEIEANMQEKRQVLDDDEMIDEELKYYYADRALQHINQASGTNNLVKLISIHAVDSSVHMGANMVRLYIETALTFCLKHADEDSLPQCEEMDGIDHKLCLARLWPSPDDELVVQSISVVCDEDRNFATVTGLSIPDLLKISIKELENSRDQKYKLVHLGEPQVIPSLNSNVPNKLDFIVGFTNCTKDVDLEKKPFDCYLDTTKSSKPCTSFIWFTPNSREIYQIDVKCRSSGTRKKRSVSMNLANTTADDLEIHKLVQESLEKLEMSSIHRYKQRVIVINSYSTKITTGKVTTIDFDVGYTSCLKYEWVNDITTCEFLEHLPRRHCVSHVYERLWRRNGRNIEVTCEDDETPLEAHIEFESAEMAMQLAKEALKHIEAKYPHPRKQTVVRIFSLEKQVVAGIHYRLKIEVGLTDCSALSGQADCKLVKDEGLNKFCRVNVWLRPWTDHPPNYRVTCDYHEAATAEVYHQLQAEHLFYEFLSTYKPNYINDRTQMRQRFEIFKENVRKMHELNTHERGTATYGVTRFADLTYEEFTTKHMGLKTSLRDPNQVPFTKADIPKVTLPASFDWRDHGAVTEVKDQGSCGSCWAFSVTGNIEGQWKMHTGKLVSLSEQELVDCDKLDQGCNGGLPDNAYRAIEQLGGLETEADYPYEGSDDKCTFNKTLARVQISGAVNITTNETDMAKWLVKNGPISIGINANAMQFYMGGISHPWRMLCNPSNLDHGVLIVGYGTKDYPLFHKHLPYWTIKNSWGTSWGEQGYYRVYRGDGTCGVNQMASSAII